MTFDTLQNTSECHEVPRLPRETQKLALLENLPEARPYSNRADGCEWLRTVGQREPLLRERKGKEGNGRDRKGKEGNRMERTGKERKERERKGKKGKERERKGKDGKGRERKGKDGKGRKGREKRLIWKSAAVAWPCSNELAWLLRTVTQCFRAELKWLYFELSPPWHLSKEV